MACARSKLRPRKWRLRDNSERGRVKRLSKAIVRQLRLARGLSTDPRHEWPCGPALGACKMEETVSLQVPKSTMQFANDIHQRADFMTPSSHSTYGHSAHHTPRVSYPHSSSVLTQVRSGWPDAEILTHVWPPSTTVPRSSARHQPSNGAQL